MAFLKRKKTKKEETADVRRKRRESKTVSTNTSFLDTSKTISAFIFFLIWGFIVLICFVGLSPAGPQILPDRVAKFRVVAEFPFDYESILRTKRLVEQRRQSVAPFYQIQMEPYQDFSAKIVALENLIETQLTPELDEIPEAEWPDVVDRFNRREIADIGLKVNTEDLLLIMQRTTPEQRTRLFDEASLVLRDIMREGVFDIDETPFADQSGSGYRPVQVMGLNGGRRAQSEENAVSDLRINFAGLGVDNTLARAIYSIYRNGLTANLEYDSTRTEAEKQSAGDSVQPVIVEIMEGETIIEPGAVITQDQIEAYTAYRNAVAEDEDYGWGIDSTLAERAVLSLGLLIGALIYIQVGLPSMHRSNRRLALAALVVVFNLALVRLVLQLGETRLVGAEPGIMAMIPFAVPVAVGGLIMSIMVGAPAGVLIAVIISAINGLMQANSIDVFIVSLLANLVGIYFGRDIRLRAKVVKAATMSGLSIAVAAMCAGFFTETDAITVSRQVIAAGMVGVLTGIVVIGVLPLLENLFKFTTDITLLELTDYNHPLLRKLQMDAPGTYHHSLMVANLAERAANEIGANPLLCRATCLYHDIGKMVKPEYFVENQHDGYNPHKDINPTMSALIIKNHVKEGVQMAKDAKLPTVCIDIIKQHHGTTLIKFFYHKAKEQAAQPSLPLSASGQTAGLRESSNIDESSFRYDGPRPRFKESAIIFFADAIEAASRSLKKVTPQSVNELIDSIISQRLEDGQLDEAPLTVQEIAKIRDSFAFTVTNMLHSRVEYPKMDDEKDKKAERPRGDTPTPIDVKEKKNGTNSPTKQRAV
ncbi:HDIG domain-containing metalloprotein [Rubellicoccus peritrichatus]|uniref:HDIG domain-containing protein n=1 Tax=Rubellicoccus peritrichatus TaxID=3080537 RepID=A0AAQ3LAH1_9BACT|nr:HDIG domain-containing metalloprotein [Puniceicoccus sp. CR14]WOO40360.1 HDIG domain-containing protein [Puniceicoccus sp. CR14]